MTTKPTIQSVMTSFPYVIDVEASLAEARRMMVEYSVRHLPVKEGDRLVGLLTDRDLKLVLGPYSDVPKHEGGPRVREACLFDVYTVEMGTPLRTVAEEMARRHIGSALVTKKGRLAGIFTATDACRCLAEVLSVIEPPSGDEAA
jgi:acetoin utilization protein AcuB